ncbi:murein hydrolase activator EnvC family protein [Kingella oralis]|uniref:murein hydrolase activator EnvC family protein n=1 Tax=Kingella oralis TaxID=505 RepID=UPI0034E4F448
MPRPKGSLKPLPRYQGSLKLTIIPHFQTLNTRKPMKTPAALLITLALLAPQIAPAANEAPAANATPANAQLDTVRDAIAATQKDLEAKQAAQRRAAQILRETQIAIAKARRELNELTQREQAEWQKLTALQATLSQLQTNISNTKAQVAQLLANNYKNPQPAAVALLLKSSDANQKSRFLTYTRHINQANKTLINKLVQQQSELNSQQQAINTELKRIEQLAAQQRQKLKKLGQTQSQAQANSNQLSKDINARRQKLAQLQANERQLNQIIANIVAKQNAQRKAEAEQRAQEARKRAQAANQRSKAPQSTLTREDLNLRPEQPQRAELPRTEAAPQKPLRGIMPASGNIIGRFGTARPSGGTWRGIFIATAPAPVRSIAAGTVVYTANQAGYGNMMIIDHGNGYMSVYAGLSAIHAGNGSRVNAGQNIATSGTLPAGEQGLYLELRYRNKIMNPLVWLR